MDLSKLVVFGDQLVVTRVDDGPADDGGLDEVDELPEDVDEVPGGT